VYAVRRSGIVTNPFRGQGAGAVGAAHRSANLCPAASGICARRLEETLWVDVDDPAWRDGQTVEERFEVGGTKHDLPLVLTADT
jgi:hypothetical protein